MIINRKASLFEILFFLLLFLIYLIMTETLPTFLVSGWSESIMAFKTYHGSCYCGKVTFETDLDLDTGTFKCNCGICWKGRFWGAIVKTETFRVVTGQDDLSVYGKQRLHHFCKHCGIKLFGRGADGIRVVVNVASLDDLDPVLLSRAPVRYVDGRNDNFKSVPDFTGHL